jgi:hypothetical protein
MSEKVSETITRRLHMGPRPQIAVVLHLEGRQLTVDCDINDSIFEMLSEENVAKCKNQIMEGISVAIDNAINSKDRKQMCRRVATVLHS